MKKAVYVLIKFCYFLTNNRHIIKVDLRFMISFNLYAEVISMHNCTLPAVIKTTFLYIVCVQDVWMVHAEVCVQMHAPMNTRAKVRGAPSTFSLSLPCQRQSLSRSLPFSLARPASCSVCLSSPQHWGCMLLSTKMLGIWSQVCLLS